MPISCTTQVSPKLFWFTSFLQIFVESGQDITFLFNLLSVGIKICKIFPVIFGIRCPDITPSSFPIHMSTIHKCEWNDANFCTYQQDLYCLLLPQREKFSRSLWADSTTLWSVPTAFHAHWTCFWLASFFRPNISRSSFGQSWFPQSSVRSFPTFRYRQLGPKWRSFVLPTSPSNDQDILSQLEKFSSHALPFYCRCSQPPSTYSEQRMMWF